MEVHVWRVPADFTSHLADESVAQEDPFTNPLGPRELCGSTQVAQPLCDYGVDFPPGSYARLSLTSGKLEVANTPDNLDLVDQLIEREGITLRDDGSLDFDASSSVLSITAGTIALDEAAELLTQLAIEESKARAGL